MNYRTAPSADGPSASHVPEATLRDPPRAVTSVLALKSTEANHLLAADISSFTEHESQNARLGIILSYRTNYESHTVPVEPSVVSARRGMSRTINTPTHALAISSLLYLN